LNNDKQRVAIPSMEWMRQTILDYQQECDGIAQDMSVVAAEFKAVFRLPCPVFLTVQKLNTGSIYLRWRLVGARRRQPYILMEGETATDILKTMTPDVRQIYYRFHQHVLYLNAKHAMRLAEKRRWEGYRQQRQDLEQLKNEFKIKATAMSVSH
jgi:hypothetical protein